ncbi:hypothetical protein ABL78_4892 [Leptomonas seymouri]|uniref:Uncharacterized protein n=1 Tax=Leptomonas seymouri TaxID=5684 RepID=A0A0N1PBA9_LEPSE|nr:hypothetical protein ABL78_4892 [Leptomonas seymouri]|eukprot:KPI86054.1 hypothetical protein ABL78_4892 [Leptomonas seymouri]
MRCSAAAFLTNAAGGGFDASGCSWQPGSAFTLPPAHTDGPFTACHAEIRHPATCQQRAPSPRQTFMKVGDGGALLRQQSRYSTISDGSSVGRSNYAPRPVTVRQLYAAVLGVPTELAPFPSTPVSDGEEPTIVGAGCGVRTQQPSHRPPQRYSSAAGSTPAADAAPLQSASMTSSRIGDSTVLMDGAACHTVVVCGRVVRFEVAVRAQPAPRYPGRASSGAAPSYDFMWITDNTGLLCVLRPRSGQARRQQLKQGVLEGRCSISLPHLLAVPEQDVFLTQRGAYPKALQTSSCDSWNTQPSKSRPRTLAGGAVGARGNDILHSAQLPLTTLAKPDSTSLEQLTDDVPRAGDHTVVSDGIDCLDSECDEEEAEAFYINDYVVCTGALAFADVELAVASALSRDAETLRSAALAAVASGAAADSPSSRCTSEMEGEPLKPCETYVLLPGSEVPLRLDAVQTELGLVGPLPPQTRYLTEQEARQWGDDVGAANAAGVEKDGGDLSIGEVGYSPQEHSKCLPSGLFGSQRRKHALGGGVEMPPTMTSLRASASSLPLLCIKGHPRLITDSTECLYWWLSAVETHFRLKGSEKAVRAS